MKLDRQNRCAGNNRRLRCVFSIEHSEADLENSLITGYIHKVRAEVKRFGTVNAFIEVTLVSSIFIILYLSRANTTAEYIYIVHSVVY